MSDYILSIDDFDLRQAFFFVNNSNWDRADRELDKILEKDPSNSVAYVGKLLVSLKEKKYDKLPLHRDDARSNIFYVKALDYADDELKNDLLSKVSNPDPATISAYEDEKAAEASIEKPLYSLDGARGRHLDVYGNKVVLRVKATIGSLLTGNVTDGEKTIYYSDCIGLQYKKTGLTIGYIQFETASGMMNNKANNFFNENTFTWDSSVSNLTNEKMEEVVQYCKNKIDEYKPINKIQEKQSISIADEIFKIKALLDSGAITEEEYNLLKDKIIKTC